MRANILFLIPCLLTCTLLGNAQVSIEGQVNHDGSAVDMVTIQVYEHGKIQRTVAANKRGKYDLVFPYNHEYTLVFRRPFMIPVKIGVNTDRPDETKSNVLVSVPLNMELFMRFKGMDITAYEKPIGSVNRVGVGENSFDFVPDTEVLNAIKMVNKESTNRKNAGEEPIDSDEPIFETESTIKLVEPKSTEVEELSRIENVEKSITNENADSMNSKISPTIDLDAKELESASERYNRIEDGENESNRQERSMQNRKNQSIASVGSDQEDFIIDSKIGRNEREEDRLEEGTFVANSRVQKQDRLLSDLAASSKSKTKIRQRIAADKEPILKEFDEGTFVSEESLSIQENGTVAKYRKVTYNWLLFEMDYFYKNEIEISENAYNEVRGLFD